MKFKNPISLGAVVAALAVAGVGTFADLPVSMAPAATAQTSNCWLSEAERNPAHIILTANEEGCTGNEIQLVTQGSEVANLTAAIGTTPLITITLKCRDNTELRIENYPLVDRTSYFPKPGCAVKNFARVSMMNFKPSDIVGKLKIRLTP
jgi:hypothetical protein